MVCVDDSVGGDFQIVSMEALFKLLRIGLGTEAEVSVPEGADWPALVALATKQGVAAVAYDGLQKCYEADPRLTLPIDLDQKMVKYDWFGSVLSGEIHYGEYCKAIRDLASFYQEQGIPMMLLKGYGLSLNYPVPAHRPCGDIDIYLFGRWEEADKAVADKLGVKVDNSHHHHSVFHFGQWSVENHYDFINVHAHRSNRRIEAELKRLASGRNIEHKIDGVTVLLPNPNLNALFILKHAAGHFASTRLSLRQVLDWLLFVRQCGAEVDWPWLYGILRRENMVRFANSLAAIGVEFFGMDPALFYEVEKDKALVQRVLGDILEPEFKGRENGKLLTSLWVKPRRWWQNRWKHRICYSDSLISSFLWSLHAKFLKPAHFIH